MPIASYLRVSTEEQRERQSIATQREFGARYCLLHNLAVYRVYADDGVSGTVPLEDRPDGAQILRDARLGKFDQLLVYKLDRLGRETRLILNAVAELEKYGVRVRSMTEEFDTGTATGRLMLTMLSGFASHEREVIRERSVAGTNWVTEAGVWLGGIVPYGYQKAGEKQTSHLVVSEEPIPGLAMSEAEVIREVFRMAAVERKSCRVIAERLNGLRVPCAYCRDDRLVQRGKRKQRTSGVWRPGRIRGLLINKTYMGTHEFGKRSATGRPIISRPAPAIVTEATWEKAQRTLHSNFLFGKRSAKNQYLLRGLIMWNMERPGIVLLETSCPEPVTLLLRLWLALGFYGSLPPHVLPASRCEPERHGEPARPLLEFAPVGMRRHPQASSRRMRSAIYARLGAPHGSKPRTNMRIALDGKTRRQRTAPGRAGCVIRSVGVSDSAASGRPRGRQRHCKDRWSRRRTTAHAHSLLPFRRIAPQRRLA
jgi:DNA invertase Pin-like site-specific DNA recombinase